MDIEDFQYDLDTFQEALEASETIKHMKREINALKETNSSLRGQLESLVMLFEYRVDSIYARLGELLEEQAGPHVEVHLEQPTPVSGEPAVKPKRNRNSEVDVAAFKSLIADKRFLADQRSRYIRPKRPTVFRQPLHAFGFKYRSENAAASDGCTAVFGADGRDIAVFGPYFSAEPGHYELVFRSCGTAAIQMDVFCNFSDRILSSYDSEVDNRKFHKVEFEVTTAEHGHGLEFRYFTGDADYQIFEIVVLPRAL